MPKKIKVEPTGVVTILGAELEEKHYPRLYSLAKNNPSSLENTIKNICAQEGWPVDPQHAGSCFVFLGSDLGD